MKEGAFDDEVHSFFVKDVDSVPQMEALLLLWENRPKEWAPNELSDRLYVDSETLRGVMAPLVHRAIVRLAADGAFAYDSSPERDRRMEKVSNAYRRNLVRATTIIHSKGSSGAREFARAFKFAKERE